MNIKIKTWEALKMLKQVNPLLTNNEIPLEILNTVEELLENKDIGRNGYISIILTPVQDDTSDILEELNLDHTLVRIPDNNFLQIDIKNKKHPMNENRRWVSYDLEFLDRQGKVYVIYSMKTVGE